MAKVDYPKIGAKFGRLVVSSAGWLDGANYKVPVSCSCGKSLNVGLYNLRKGRTKSCGCLHAEELSKRRLQHGRSGSSSYLAWQAMLNRCRRTETQNYANYGGRGIRVCRRWLSFENFLLDMGERPFPRAQLDRKNNNGNYCKSNCRWVTPAENALNKRNSLKFRFRGRLEGIATIARVLGLSYHRLYGRLVTFKMTPEKAFKLPGKKQK